MLPEKSKIKFDSIALMGLSSLHAAYGPGDYSYILIVIETTQTRRLNEKNLVSLLLDYFGKCLANRSYDKIFSTNA